VGKSALLKAFAADARAAGATVVALDGRSIEPTEQGLAAKLGRTAALRARKGAVSPDPIEAPLDEVRA
jgi:hypothetical protein